MYYCEYAHLLKKRMEHTCMSAIYYDQGSDIKVKQCKTIITMPDMAYVSIFMDNDLTHITEDHFEIKLIARLLNQIYVIQPPMLPPRYDDAPPEEYEYSQPHTSTDGARPSAPQFPEHLHSLLTHS